MPVADERPTSVLSTLALLKANVDAGDDHIGMFLPFVLDVVASFPSDSVTAAEVMDALASRLKLEIPQYTVTTLLSRATKKGFLRREHRRYWKIKERIPESDLPQRTESLKKEHLNLGLQFCKYLQERGLSPVDSEEALKIIVDFLERNHIAMVLNEAIPVQSGISVPSPPSQFGRLVARFVQERVSSEPALASVLEQIIQGLVLQKTLLLKDIAKVRKKFKHLRVFFDTRIILQALGYQGEPARVATTTALKTIKAHGASVEVFSDTVDEIKRIFDLYESRLGSSHGRDSLYANDLTRFFLTNNYGPSDVVEVIATLELDIRGLGISVRQRPRHEERYTLDEKELASRLAKDDSPEFEPRVWHDVNCVASVLTLRKGHMTDDLDNAKAIFATTTGLVVRNVTQWWMEQLEQERLTASTSRLIAPVVHQIALSNHAWLKDPASASTLKLRELIALCYAALKPTEDSWKRFKRHLQKLKDSNKITSEEVAVIMASHLTEASLSAAEDDGELDAETLDDVVDQVKSTYAAQANASAAEARRAEQERRSVELRLQAKAGSLADVATRLVFGFLAAVVAVAIFLGARWPDSWWSIPSAAFAVCNILFGMYLYQGKSRFREWLTDRILVWWLGSRPAGY